MVFDLPAKYVYVENDIGRTLFNLRADVENWLNKKCPNEWHWRIIDRREAYIIIHDEKIAVEFKLIWL
jgi:hypothetical protein